MLIKISKLAKDLGVTKATLYNWRLAGKIQFVKSKTGMNFVTQETYNEFLGIKEKREEKVVVYCRVSSTVNKKNLQTQRDRLINYCNARGYQVHKVVTEFGSGINDKRPKLEKLLTELDFTKIVVEHKDRLSRMGFHFLEILCETHHKEIEVINTVDTDEEDIIQDFISIITSYCAKIYGKRRSKRKTEKLIQQLKNEKDN
jgi:putative resolvase